MMAAVDIGGVRLAYDDEGRSPDVIVLVHGHPFDRSSCGPHRESFTSAGWRVIVPGLRGSGETGLEPDAPTLRSHVAELAALLDHLDVGSVVVAGLSMGGQLAIEFCRTYPDRVRGLLLVATAPREETPASRQARGVTTERLLREGVERCWRGRPSSSSPRSPSLREAAAAP